MFDVERITKPEYDAMATKGLRVVHLVSECLYGNLFQLVQRQAPCTCLDSWPNFSSSRDPSR